MGLCVCVSVLSVCPVCPSCLSVLSVCPVCLSCMSVLSVCVCLSVCLSVCSCLNAGLTAERINLIFCIHILIWSDCAIGYMILTFEVIKGHFRSNKFLCKVPSGGPARPDTFGGSCRSDVRLLQAEGEKVRVHLRARRARCL